MPGAGLEDIAHQPALGNEIIDLIAQHPAASGLFPAVVAAAASQGCAE
jgi:hypothetical protein